ncbi:MAG: FAD-binding oxidoreductase [Pseudomonadota bacterium]|jgi:glycine/D-amino acid oxidase-like deaminating enzyme|nr:FAD-binding oxidoreductase [Pseudomonadota bacterium]
MSRGEYDVAVIGAGLMGAGTALFLARGGMRCVLLDRKGICSEASGVNAGTLTMQMTRADLIPYAMKGWEMWTHSREWLGLNPGVVATPGLSLAFTEEEVAILEYRAAARRERGAEIELITASRARSLEPGLSNAVMAAAYCATDGFAKANETGFVLNRALVDAGVDINGSAVVDRLEPENSCYAVISGQDIVRATRVVLAGGVWLEEMLGWLGVRIPIKTLVNQLGVTERIAPVMHTVIGIASGLLSLKQFDNGTVVIGGGWQGRGDRQTGISAVVPENLVGNARLAVHAVPGLSNTRLVRAWCGFEAETADAMPLLGPVPGIADAFVIGSVHSGYTSGPFMAKLLSEHMLGHDSALPLFDPQRLIENKELQPQ